MPDQSKTGSQCDLSCVKESVCIHTRKIFDSCRDKDCLEDLRFYPTVDANTVLANSRSIKGGTAELLYVYTDVEPVNFNRGYFAVDMRFFYRVTLHVYTGTPRYTEIEGLCVFDKRTILFGSEGNAKIFSSDTVLDEMDVPRRERTNMPTAVVEAVDPIVLNTRVSGGSNVPVPVSSALTEIPAFIAQAFSAELVLEEPASPNGFRIYVTLGQFTMVRLERETQLLIPIYDYCVSQCDCMGGCEPPVTPEDACEMFRNVSFPVSEFFPPNSLETPSDYCATRNYCANRE